MKISATEKQRFNRLICTNLATPSGFSWNQLEPRNSNRPRVFWTDLVSQLSAVYSFQQILILQLSTTWGAKNPCPRLYSWAGRNSVNSKCTSSTSISIVLYGCCLAWWRRPSQQRRIVEFDDRWGSKLFHLLQSKWLMVVPIRLEFLYPNMEITSWNCRIVGSSWTESCEGQNCG